MTFIHPAINYKMYCVIPNIKRQFMNTQNKLHKKLTNKYTLPQENYTYTFFGNKY